MYVKLITHSDTVIAASVGGRRSRAGHWWLGCLSMHPGQPQGRPARFGASTSSVCMLARAFLLARYPLWHLAKFIGIGLIRIQRIPLRNYPSGRAGIKANHIAPKDSG